MSVIKLQIDTKSLYINIKNDNLTGHTATVATPLQQGASVHSGVSGIYDIPENIRPQSRENLVSKILSKSRAQAIITRTCVFNKISVNGVYIENTPSYCIYIREETDPSNVHCGRKKLHYPISLCYEDADITINNRIVISLVSQALNNYAFIVDSFEYDDLTKTLNFNATIVGESGIPYSKVFVNKRGVGNKFTSKFHEANDNYDTEIIALREAYGYDQVSPENFLEYGEKGFCTAKNMVIHHLKDIGGKNIQEIRTDYPYSIYDLSYTIDGTKRYALIVHTATREKYFSLPLKKIRFFNDFSSETELYLVTNTAKSPALYKYALDDINKLSKSIDSITFEDRN